MTVTVVQWNYDIGPNVALDAPGTPGNTLVYLVARRDSGEPTDPGLGGWTTIAKANHTYDFQRSCAMWYRVVTADESGVTGAGDGVTYPIQTGNRGVIVEIEGVYAGVSAEQVVAGSTTMDCGGSVTTPDGFEAIVFGVGAIGSPGSITEFSDTTGLVDEIPGGFAPYNWMGYRDAGPGETVAPGGTQSSTYFCGVSAVFTGISTTFPEPDPSTPGTETPNETEPPGVFLEIYVTPEDSYRWDVAEWDEATWSSAAWTDVTPESISCTIRTGVERAELGILAKVVAADWTVYTYDPDRRLDPANAEGPWYPEIVAGLPIRLSYRNTVLAQGVCLRITYGYADGEGEIRATDSLYPLRSAIVPEAASLPDTLFARTRAVLAAVGLEQLYVDRDPAGGDIPLSPWDLGTSDSAWTIIEESARECLWFPMVGPTGAIFFRAWNDPLERGAVIGSPNMEEMHVTTMDDGVYSVVRVNDDVSDTTIERRITPTPRYGERVHERTRLTIDGEAYADAILFDRGAASMRWVPGDVHAFTADDVEYFARIVPGEVAHIDYPEAEPPLTVRTRVLQRTLHVIGSNVGPGQNSSKWWFRYSGSVEAAEPLHEDAAMPTYLTADDGSGLLYPDGVIALT